MNSHLPIVADGESGRKPLTALFTILSVVWFVGAILGGVFLSIGKDSGSPTILADWLWLWLPAGVVELTFVFLALKYSVIEKPMGPKQRDPRKLY